jgi:hypothetical protein
MNLIDKGDQGYKTVHGRFTAHLADLLPLNTRLASDLAIGLGVQLDVSANGQSFLAQVASNVLSLVPQRWQGHCAELPHSEKRLRRQMPSARLLRETLFNDCNNAFAQVPIGLRST